MLNLGAKSCPGGVVRIGIQITLAVITSIIVVLLIRGVSRDEGRPRTTDSESDWWRFPESPD
jgi:hypothetical protein